ncbi:hypothetical protein ACOME3_001713 [Neoechinorhynchus agilis]
MVIIKDPISDFYLRLRDQRVVVFLSETTDSICTWMILRNLFATEHVMYSVCTVRTINVLEQEFSVYRDQCIIVILLNCGGCLDAIKLLGSDHEIYIIDNLRPFHLSNVISANQVKLVVNKDELETELNHIPWKAILDRADSSRQSLTTSTAESDLEMYYRSSYHPYPSALVAYQIAYLTSRDNVYLLWCVLVALTDLYSNGRIPKRTYLSYCGILETHSSRVNQPQDNLPNGVPIITYQHSRLNGYFQYWWTLSDFFRTSINMYTIFNLSQSDGQARLNEFFGELGISIEDTKQYFPLAHPRARNGLALVFERQYMEKYRYSRDTISLPTFCMRFDNNFDLSASDFALCLQTLLIDSEIFNSRAGSALSQCSRLFIWHDRDPLKVAVESSKLFLKRTITQMNDFIMTDQVIAYDSVYFVPMNYEHKDREKWLSVSALKMLALYIIRERYFHVIRRSRGRMQSRICKRLKRAKAPKDLSIILSVPVSETNSLLVGIPEYEESEMNPFFSLFERAAKEVGIEIESNYFDKSGIIVSNKDRWKLVSKVSDLIITYEGVGEV